MVLSDFGQVGLLIHIPSFTTLVVGKEETVSISLDVNQIFTYAEDIVNSLLPLAYVVGGIGLGFVVINRIISAFR